MTAKIPVPSDLSNERQSRPFLDRLSGAVRFISKDGDADFTTLKEDGKRAFIQGSTADEGGLEHTPYDHGTMTTGTLTLDPAVRLHQEVVCNGAITISPASTDYHGTAVLHITNGSSAGTKTPSGFTKQYTGDAFTNTNAHKFAMIFYFFGSDGCDYIVKARQ